MSDLATSESEASNRCPDWQRLGIMDLILLVAIVAVVLSPVTILLRNLSAVIKIAWTVVWTLAIGAPVLALRQRHHGRRVPPSPGEGLCLLQSAIFGGCLPLFSMFRNAYWPEYLLLGSQVVMLFLGIIAITDVFHSQKFWTERWTSWVGIAFAILAGLVTSVYVIMKMISVESD